MENQEVNLESTLTESMLSANVSAQSTPSTTRARELSMDDMFNLIKTMSENINSNLNAKFEEQQIDSNVKYNKINEKFDVQKNSFGSKFDELTNQIKEINKHLESINEIVRTSLNKLEQSVEKLGDNVISMTSIKNCLLYTSRCV